MDYDPMGPSGRVIRETLKCNKCVLNKAQYFISTCSEIFDLRDVGLGWHV